MTCLKPPKSEICSVYVDPLDRCLYNVGERRIVLEYKLQVARTAKVSTSVERPYANGHVIAGATAR